MKFIVCTPSPFLLEGKGREGLNLLHFQKGGLGRTFVFRGSCWESGGDFFQEGGELQFFDKKNIIWTV